MKNFLKFFFTLIMAAFLVGAGYYLVLSNLCYLLAAGKPNLQCQRVATGFLIKTGEWVERVNLKAPFKVFRKDGVLVFQTTKMILTVSTKPKFQIRWKKSLSI